MTVNSCKEKKDRLWRVVFWSMLTKERAKWLDLQNTYRDKDSFVNVKKLPNCQANVIATKLVQEDLKWEISVQTSVLICTKKLASVESMGSDSGGAEEIIW